LNQVIKQLFQFQLRNGLTNRSRKWVCVISILHVATAIKWKIGL